MIFDVTTMFGTQSNGRQPIAAAVGTLAGAKVLDLGVTHGTLGPDAGTGGSSMPTSEPIYLTAQVINPTAAAGLTGFQIVIDTSQDNTTWTQVMASPVLTRAQFLQGGFVFCERVPLAARRYLRARYISTGAGGVTGGEIACGLTLATVSTPILPQARQY